jgi:2-oxoisovalerate dehydrogenase E1 component alpha subunit
MYKNMLTLQTFDHLSMNLQRTGRISFYMQNAGEEGLQIGCSAGLQPTDMIFGQYREAGVLFHRGFSLQQMADQCFSNKDDLGKGRQMPVHYGSKAHHFQTISSPLATQLPQAAGAAYAIKTNNTLPTGEIGEIKDDRMVVCFFGEGAASEGDFHAALNFSATCGGPIMYVCRNNGFAISTPSTEQFKGDGIVSRAIGYGMHALRVDGNDTLAMRKAVETARALSVENQKPVLLEAMTYRLGHHSTSDDSTRYREKEEIDLWREEALPESSTNTNNSHPIARMYQYLVHERKVWSEQENEDWKKEAMKGVRKALKAAEKKGKPSIEELFTDVYDTKPWHLQEQEEALKTFLANQNKQ